jgi:urea carboxylase
MFSKVLVANRGEIACRIIKTLKELNVCAVAVYSEADADSAHVAMADEAYLLGPAPAKESYLNTDKILQIMRDNGVEAVHPGYGFLSENVEFGRACADNNIEFIGPTEEQILEFGLKHRARALAEAAGVPLVPGTGLLAGCDEAVAEAEKVGYPVMLKSTAGGGGIGMKICGSPEELEENFETIKRLGRNYFKDEGIFLEKYIETSRHIEVQVFGDGAGKVVTLGERDCSVQRRNQKVIEETPAPGISEETRSALHAAAKRLAETVDYRSAGTVEFIYDTAEETFYFLEVNTRLQVEHGITEEVFGVDLVRWMVELAAGENPIETIETLRPSGCAMEFRIYAEDPGKDYQPSSGKITRAQFPEEIRCDKWIKSGTEVGSFYDPLLAKVIVTGANRTETIEKSKTALGETLIAGFETNLCLLRQILEFAPFADGDVSTKMLNGFDYRVATIEVLKPGTQTTVQDVPGRLGFWGIGVPPSGPMDALNFRLANRLVGNAPEATALEMTMIGGTFRFNAATQIAVTGGELPLTLNGEPVERYRTVEAAAGDVLDCGTLSKGQRVYLAVRGGFDVPEYMGSRATFILGKFGGHAGRALTYGDILHIGGDVSKDWKTKQLAEDAIPELSNHWKIGVMIGPHGAPEFFTDKDVSTFFETEWDVHYNSSRTGVRLMGPTPEWAREDGGEAGLHPSNIHDNAYAIGSIDYTGDMPIVLGPDGPSLGGFVCPATIVQAELWKMGQVRPGDTIRFFPVTAAQAESLEIRQEQLIETLAPQPAEALTPFDGSEEPAIVKMLEEYDVVYRQAGDKYLLIEYGELQIDMEMRFRVHRLELELQELHLDGMIDMTAGIRSLQLHFDSRVLPRAGLLDILESIESKFAANQGKRCIPSRIVHMPLAWDDITARKASEIYTKSVRANAPWCPDNKEFIRRINGLDSIQDVYDIVYGANYIVMGLGDVYLGAPVSISYDPRHRLVTTKYNPARTWTAENAVGIGGAYMGIYGMEGPGGYQLVGRTVQTWNTYNQTENFTEPWLFRCFDQIRYYPVSHEELMQMRRDLPIGAQTLKIEESTFDLDEYLAFLKENKAGINAFKQRQQAAFDAERRDWVEKGLLNFKAEDLSADESKKIIVIPEGSTAVTSSIAGSLWKMHVEPGDTVTADQPLAILECMKMEIGVTAPHDGVVTLICSAEGDTLKPGQELLAIEPII